MKIPTQTYRHCATAQSQDIWHSRLGHISSDRLQYLISRGVLGQVKQNKVDCVSCKLSKHHALPFNNSASISSAPFDLVHSDIWGHSPTKSMSGFQYLVIFIDDYSRYVWIYLLRSLLELEQICYNFLQLWCKPSFHVRSKLFDVIMPWSIEKRTLKLFLHKTVLYFSILVLGLLNKMARPKESIVISLILFVHCLYLLPFKKCFGEKLLLLLFITLILCPLQ